MKVVKVIASTVLIASMMAPAAYAEAATQNPNVDSDGDGLTNQVELLLQTNPNKKDTDGDGLDDYFEYISKLYSPILKDTDGNGVSDGDEDADSDGLTNLQELAKGTNPYLKDTDNDGLHDGEEVEKGTNPLADDSDRDGLIDSEEERLHFHPLNPDTDGDGILDGDEIMDVEIAAPAYLQNKPSYPSITIKTQAKNAFFTKIQPVSTNHPILNNSIPGLIGNAYGIYSDIDIEEAKITFHYANSARKKNFQPSVFYYDEEKQTLEKVPNQVHDAKTRTVTAALNHVGIYVLIDSVKWERAWEEFAQLDDHTKDTDNDGIPDVYETHGIIIGTGSLIKTDPNNPDTDQDGILDGDEIQFEQNAKYATLLSNPTKKDSDGDGIEDAEEKPGEALVYNVTDEALAVFSDIAYLDVKSHANSKEQAQGLEDFSNQDVPPIPLSKESIQHSIRLKKKAALVKDWEIVGFNEDQVSGHYGIALRHSYSNNIVIAERGAKDALAEGILGYLDLLLEGNHSQVEHALAFSKNAIYHHWDNHIFVTGHSLGGFHAQVISYHLIHNTLTKNNALSSTKKKAIHHAIANHYQRTATFNSVPLFNKNSLRQLGIDMPAYTKPAIPEKEMGKQKYEKYITNYQLSYDILTIAGQYVKAGYIGKTVMFNYPEYAPKTVDNAPFNQLKELLEEYRKSPYSYIARNPSNRVELNRFLTNFYLWLSLNRPEESKQLMKKLNLAIEAHGIKNFDDYEF